MQRRRSVAQIIGGCIGLARTIRQRILQAGGQASDIDVVQIEALIEQRKAAKAAKISRRPMLFARN